MVRCHLASSVGHGKGVLFPSSVWLCLLYGFQVEEWRYALVTRFMMLIGLRSGHVCDSAPLTPHTTLTEFMASSGPTPLKNHYYQRVTSSFALLSRSLVAATYVTLDCFFYYLCPCIWVSLGLFCCCFPLVVLLGRGDA
jgi:hypothetical protein